jgi:hypothetical protein
MSYHHLAKGQGTWGRKEGYKVDMMEVISKSMSLILQFANMVIIGYALYKFLNKPHDSLEAKHEELKKRVDEHDIKFKEVEESLHHGNDRFREQEETNAVFKSVMLSFVNFEIAFCLHTDYKDTADLIEAKKELNDYLAKK